jgi:poly-gamma-glutamate capsule biosynthesis protein CapA/YwtB (metallophosphatase superfamily)
MKPRKYLYILLPVLLPAFLILNCRGTILDQKQTKKPYESDTLTFVFAGDVMGHMPQQKAAFDMKTKKYSFTDCYQFIAPFIQPADFAMANLEVPLAGKPYTGYPHFSAPDELLDGALSAGFDAMQLANNHIADKGKNGIARTYSTVNRRVPSVGVYLRESQRDSIYPLIMSVKGLKVAFLNCTYDTNGNPVSEPYVVNLIDTAQIRKDVQTARQRGAKCVVMTIHWGIEYELKANNEQVMLARFFANIGIDAVIGSHPHVVQNFEWIERKGKTTVPVFYSLGNMISNQRWGNSNGGILARLEISKLTGKILNASYLPFFVHKGKLNEKFQYYLIPTEKYLDKKYHFHIPANDEGLLKVFDEDTRERLGNIQSWKMDE